MDKALLTSKNQLWQTPPDLIDKIKQVGPIILDPATCKENPVGALTFYTPEDDGLKLPWSLQGINFVNPPYKYCKDWVRKMVAERLRGCDIIALIPSRTDTRYWQDLIFPTAESICFVRGRIKFLDPTVDGPPRAKDPAPMPSALIYWGDETGRRVFDELFSSKGFIVHPDRFQGA